MQQTLAFGFILVLKSNNQNFDFEIRKDHVKYFLYEVRSKGTYLRLYLKYRRNTEFVPLRVKISLVLLLVYLTDVLKHLNLYILDLFLDFGVLIENWQRVVVILFGH